MSESVFSVISESANTAESQKPYHCSNDEPVIDKHPMSTLDTRPYPQTDQAHRNHRQKRDRNQELEGDIGVWDRFARRSHILALGSRTVAKENANYSITRTAAKRQLAGKSERKAPTSES